jgi:hypothetical protein
VPPIADISQARREIKQEVLSMIEGISAVALGTHEMPRAVRFYRAPEHDPEKWVPVFRKDHAQTIS